MVCPGKRARSEHRRSEGLQKERRLPLYPGNVCTCPFRKKTCCSLCCISVLRTIKNSKRMFTFSRNYTVRGKKKAKQGADALCPGPFIVCSAGDALIMQIDVRAPTIRFQPPFQQVSVVE